VPPPRYGDESPTPLLADPSVRHADAFHRDAGKAYDNYRSWLAGRELVGAPYPLFAAELDDVFAEADFLLALRAEAAHRYDVYSHGFTAATVARFRGRFGGALSAGLVASETQMLVHATTTCLAFCGFRPLHRSPLQLRSMKPKPLEGSTARWAGAPTSSPFPTTRRSSDSRANR
jgi:hypothetical protein